jgi:hypothetical protein
MDALIEQKFSRMGARAKVTEARLGPRGGSTLSIDIRRDARGEYFEIRHPRDLRIDAVDVRSKERHLLLIAQTRESASGFRAAHRVVRLPSKYLCGHDERHWFVAAVPEVPGVRDVETAKEALMPQAVRDAADVQRLPRNARYLRRNRAFRRQGEWFFVPTPQLKVDERQILRNEPIRRGAGKPHFCQELFRTGGERVYVRYDYPNGLTQTEYSRLDPKVRARGRWQTMIREAQVYVRGSVRHPDHATIYLDGWHRVLMNTESQSAAMRHVAFLD